MSIPYYALDISDSIIDRLEGNPAPHERMALATGSLCSSDQERLGLCVLLASDEDKFVAKTAKRTISSWEIHRLSDAIHRQTHAKVLEYVLEFLEYNESLDQLIFSCVQLNERSAMLIAERASIHTCEEIVKNRQQLLLTPSILTVLQKNENCPEEVLSRIEAFLKMQHALPKEGEQVSVRTDHTGPAADLDIDIEKEVEAVLSGQKSPFLMLALSSSLDMFQLDDQGGGSDFSFDFSDVDGFDFDVDGEMTEQGFESLEKKIRDMSIGHKIKLAYKGNKEARSILVRDANKTVAVAVVKSGRMTDTEVASYAGNRNLCDDVIREIARNKEFTRKYPVQVALVTNPKTPVNVAMGFMATMHKKDLQALMRNRNVSSVISTAARKRYKDKYQKS
ncbi:MAG: hypothetical protein CL916_06420 [Deltaproteobacteria bacterium]|nr:hypothetical protein [Deltaproteobacteria bacterium]